MENLKSRSSVLGALSFTSGFVLLAYELVSARILAPTIGSSIYVWTSVIGTIIAALAVGFFVGGKVADARKRPEDVAWLSLMVAMAIAWTLVYYPSVLQNVVLTIEDARLQGLFASLILFAPTSFIIGVLNPYLIKLNVKSLEHSGRSVASLDALNAIGGIVGTFITGFIIFSYIGSRESFVILALLMVVASWLMVPRLHTVKRLIASVITLCLAVSVLAIAKDITIDTPAAHYEVVQGVNSDNREERLIVTGPQGAQSGIYVDNPEELVFWYTKQLAHVVEVAPTKGHILILGGGAFTLPQYLAGKYPHSRIDVVEIDPELVNIATKYFAYQHPANVHIIDGDAREYINNAKASYDIVLVDVYSDISVPFSLLTSEYASKLNSLVGSDGLVAINAIAAPEGGCKPLLQAFHGAYGSILPYGYMLKYENTARSDRSNMILVYARKEVKLKDFEPITFSPVVYGDNFMPAEQLQEACRRSGQ